MHPPLCPVTVAIMRCGVRQSRYLASAASVGGAFFEELGLHGPAKTSIKIEHLRISNFIKLYNRE